MPAVEKWRIGTGHYDFEKSTGLVPWTAFSRFQRTQTVFAEMPHKQRCRCPATTDMFVDFCWTRYQPQKVRETSPIRQTQRDSHHPFTFYRWRSDRGRQQRCEGEEGEKWVWVSWFSWNLSRFHTRMVGWCAFIWYYIYSIYIYTYIYIHIYICISISTSRMSFMVFTNPKKTTWDFLVKSIGSSEWWEQHPGIAADWWETWETWMTGQLQIQLKT